MHKDIKELKRDVTVTKHVQSEEGESTEEAKKRLVEASNAHNSEYVEL